MRYGIRAVEISPVKIIPIALAEVVTKTEQCGSFFISTFDEHINHIMKMVYTGQVYTLHHLEIKHN